MANFKSSYKNTEAVEAGWTTTGGLPTYKGISFNSWRNDPLAMKIYAIVKAANPLQRQIINNPELDAMIYGWYKKNFWDIIHGDEINNQLLADFIYDFYVNNNSALRLINSAIGIPNKVGFNEDTLRQLNGRPATCYAAIRKARKDAYDYQANNHPKFKANGTYRGWMARLNSFPESLNEVSGIGKFRLGRALFPPSLLFKRKRKKKSK